MRRRRPDKLARGVRVCAKCGKRYYRCNKVHLWDQQNPGHRSGWNLRDESFCTDCTPVKMVERILVVAQAPTLAPTRHLRLVERERRRA